MVTGFGDYQVNGNSLMKGDSVPAVRNTPGGMIIRHREYIADIYANSGFYNTVFDINPGLGGVFPWLADIANCFEEYRFRGLIFEFKSMSADNVLSTTTTSTALGTVIMATQYNSLQANFTDKRTMENYEFANSAKPSVSFIHPVECQANLDANTHLYVRQGPFTGDQRLYDIGQFQVAVQGMAFNGGVIGEIWCSYEIEFFKPKITIGNGCSTVMSQVTGTINAANCFSTTPTTTITRIYGLQDVPNNNYLVNYTNNSIFFITGTVGSYWISYIVQGTVTGNVVAPTFQFVGCSVITNFYTGMNLSQNVVSNSGTLGTGQLWWSMLVLVVPLGTGNQSTITMTAGTYPTGTTIATIQVCQFQ